MFEEFVMKLYVVFECLCVDCMSVKDVESVSKYFGEM